MIPIGFAGHLQRKKKVENANRVRAVEHLQLHLYVEASRLHFSSACHIVIAFLGPVGEVIALVLLGSLIVLLTSLMTLLAVSTAGNFGGGVCRSSDD